MRHSRARRLLAAPPQNACRDPQSRRLPCRVQFFIGLRKNPPCPKGPTASNSMSVNWLAEDRRDSTKGGTAGEGIPAVGRSLSLLGVGIFQT
jgi:hypothetical protein